MQPKRRRTPKGKGDRAKLRQGGFTLVELMIALVVVSVVMAAGFSLTISMSNGFRSQRQVQRVESNARIVLDLMASGIRAASPGLSGGKINDPCSGGPVDTIEVINSTTASDELRLVYATGGAIASIEGPQDLTAGVLLVDDNTDFEPDLFTPAVIVDPNNGAGHLVEVLASSADSTAMQIRTPGDCGTFVNATAYPTGSFVVRAVNEIWSVDNDTLFLDPDGEFGPLEAEPVAEGIEEIQVAIGIEDGIDETSLTDTGDATDEWFYNSDLDPADHTLELNKRIEDGNWRAIRISVIARETRVTDERATFLRPAVEDRPASSVPDTFRRRTLTTIVELRNFDKD